MKFRTWLVAAALWPVVTQAQLEVSVSLNAETFLVYEAVPVVVNIRNVTGRTVELPGGEESPWLSFLITDEGGRRVVSLDKAPVGGAVLIPPGDVLRRTFDLSPLYDLRSRGIYRVRAEIQTEGIHAVSAPARFTLMRGQELWRQTVALAVTDNAEEYRTYKLVSKRGEFENQLYVGVHDDPRGMVYAMYSLGTYLPVGEGFQSRVDARGTLHVLHRNGSRTFGYHVVAPNGEMVTQGNYSDFQSPPRLVASNEGLVAVAGGERVASRGERVLTDDELNPPAPAPPPKKKSWWKFWGKKSPAPAR